MLEHPMSVALEFIFPLLLRDLVEGVEGIVEDCIVDKVVGTMVDSMVEVLEAWVVDNSGFVDLAFVVRHWQHKG
jgi:hypothetical protein